MCSGWGFRKTRWIRTGLPPAPIVVTDAPVTAPRSTVTPFYSPRRAVTAAVCSRRSPEHACTPGYSPLHDVRCRPFPPGTGYRVLLVAAHFRLRNRFRGGGVRTANTVSRPDPQAAFRAVRRSRESRLYGYTPLNTENINDLITVPTIKSESADQNNPIS